MRISLWRRTWGEIPNPFFPALGGGLLGGTQLGGMGNKTTRIQGLQTMTGAAKPGQFAPLQQKIAASVVANIGGAVGGALRGMFPNLAAALSSVTTVQKKGLGTKLLDWFKATFPTLMKALDPPPAYKMPSWLHKAMTITRAKTPQEEYRRMRAFTVGGGLSPREKKEALERSQSLKTNAKLEDLSSDHLKQFEEFRVQMTQEHPAKLAAILAQLLGQKGQIPKGDRPLFDLMAQHVNTLVEATKTEGPKRKVFSRSEARKAADEVRRRNFNERRTQEVSDARRAAGATLAATNRLREAYGLPPMSMAYMSMMPSLKMTGLVSEESKIRTRAVGEAPKTMRERVAEAKEKRDKARAAFEAKNLCG